MSGLFEPIGKFRRPMQLGPSLQPFKQKGTNAIVSRIPGIPMGRLRLFLILLASARVVFAQTDSARISGRVTDQTDAVIVGAECTVTDLGTNVSISTTTNEDGIYVIPEIGR